MSRSIKDRNVTVLPENTLGSSDNSFKHSLGPVAHGLSEYAWNDKDNFSDNEDDDLCLLHSESSFLPVYSPLRKSVEKADCNYQEQVTWGTQERSSPDEDDFPIMTEEEANKLIHLAATILQAHIRGFLVRRKFKFRDFKREHDAASKIQAMWRGYHFRHHSQKAMNFKNELRVHRLQKYVATLCLFMQKTKEQHEYEKQQLLEAITLLYNKFNQLSQQVELQNLEIKNKRLELKTNAVVTLQKYWRGYSVRKKFPKPKRKDAFKSLLNSHMELQNKVKYLESLVLNNNKYNQEQLDPAFLPHPRLSENKKRNEEQNFDLSNFSTNLLTGNLYSGEAEKCVDCEISLDKDEEGEESRREDDHSYVSDVEEGDDKDKEERLRDEENGGEVAEYDDEDTSFVDKESKFVKADVDEKTLATPEDGAVSEDTTQMSEEASGKGVTESAEHSLKDVNQVDSKADDHQGNIEEEQERQIGDQYSIMGDQAVDLSVESGEGVIFEDNKEPGKGLVTEVNKEEASTEAECCGTRKGKDDDDSDVLAVMGDPGVTCQDKQDHVVTDEPYEELAVGCEDEIVEEKKHGGVELSRELSAEDQDGGSCDADGMKEDKRGGSENVVDQDAMGNGMRSIKASEVQNVMLEKVECPLHQYHDSVHVTDNLDEKDKPEIVETEIPKNSQNAVQESDVSDFANSGNLPNSDEELNHGDSKPEASIDNSGSTEADSERVSPRLGKRASSLLSALKTEISGVTLKHSSNDEASSSRSVLDKPSDDTGNNGGGESTASAQVVEENQKESS